MYCLLKIDNELYSKLVQLKPAPGERVCRSHFPLALGQARLRGDCVALAVCRKDVPVGYLEYSIVPAGDYRLHTLFFAAGEDAAAGRRWVLESLLRRAAGDRDCRCVRAWLREEELADGPWAALGFAPSGRQKGLTREVTLACPRPRRPRGDDILGEEARALIGLLLRAGLSLDGFGNQAPAVVY